MDTINELSRLISGSSNIVAFTGAGASTESNIPDFRSSDGVYEKISRKYGYPPEVLLSHSFFASNPEIFFDYLKKYLVFPDAQPNAVHMSLAKLENAGKLRAVVTQNIDGLHTRAGSKKVLELHGSLYQNYCVDCGKKYPLDFVLKAHSVPRCKCGGIVRPGIVLYEEAPDYHTMDEAAHLIAHADLMLVIGTSLVVYPAAGLLRYFHGDSLVLINKSQTPYDTAADLIINEPAGETLEAVLNLLKL